MRNHSLVAASLFAVLAACAEEAPRPDVRERWPRPGVTDRTPVEDPPAPPACIPIERGAVQLGTPQHDELWDVAVTSTGTILVAGFEDGRDATAAGGPVTSRGIVDAYSPDLTAVERRAALATGGADSFQSLAIAPDTGTVWLAARTNADLAGVETRGDFDYVVGDLRSAEGFHPSARGLDQYAEHARQLAVGPGGMLALVGSQQGMSLHGGTWTHPFLAAFRTTGTTIEPSWLATRRVASERYDAVDVSADAVVAGGSILDGFDQGLFVAMYDRDAGAGWRRRLSNLGRDTFSAVKFLPDGDVVWLGTSRSQLGEELHGGSDIVIARLDRPSGATRWIVQLGTAYDDHAADLALDAQGRIHVVGAVSNATGDTLDPTLFVLDADGILVSKERWGGTGDTKPTAVTVDACGAVVIVGHTDASFAGPSHGGRDGFVLVTRH